MTAGVTFLDHTADVGFDLRTAGARELFDLAARGMLALLRGEDDLEADDGGVAPGARAGTADDLEVRPLAVSAPDGARLLADWLRELLFLHEVEKLDYAGAVLDVLELAGPAEPGAGERPCRLAARVRLRPGGDAVREIKGVTYHGMAVRRTAAGWTARVIFDV